MKETIFCFPKDVESAIHKITCEFTLRDGSKRYLETKVEERKKAEAKYEDAIASGKTAVIGMKGRMSRDMVRIMIGQFPPMSRAKLSVHFSQKLESEDLSWCLRIPQVYIPRYIGDMSKALKALNPNIKDDVGMLEEEKEQLQHELNLMAHFANSHPPLKMRVQVDTPQRLTRVVSKNHNMKIDLTPDGNQAVMTFEDKESTGPRKDFVLLFRSLDIEEPMALSAQNEHHQQTVLVSLVPDIRPPLVRNRFLRALNVDRVDTGKDIRYDALSEHANGEEMKEQADSSSFDAVVEPRLREFIFLIDRSGSMHGDPIKMAVQALKLFIHSLPLGCKFNVVSFGTHFTKLFPESVVYSEDTLKAAIKVVSGYGADMNLTEIYAPMKNIFSQPNDPAMPKCLYLLTDGAVANTQEVVNLVKANRGQC